MSSGADPPPSNKSVARAEAKAGVNIRSMRKRCISDQTAERKQAGGLFVFQAGKRSRDLVALAQK